MVGSMITFVADGRTDIDNKSDRPHYIDRADCPTRDRKQFFYYLHRRRIRVKYGYSSYRGREIKMGYVARLF